MAYLQHTSWKDRPGAVAGVVAVHAAIGYALITGLTFTGIVETVDNPDGIFVDPIPLPPPPPTPEPEPRPKDAAASIERPLVAPRPLVDIDPARPVIEATDVILPSDDVITKVVPQPTPAYTPTARPSADPVAARPKGNPAGWVTVNDYRSSWINRELTGTARFRLEIGSDGRVANCAIMSSSGHAELDRATCALVTQRARFEPARDGTGAAVPGSYANAVRWELPG
ncbi:MAG: energy transducer TonB [Cypionkella sp.]